jgi:2-keto-4-pentenoate hydratase/2-oxohepta-3-ene-1,7-dioic acid hydratase in catechol pathway
MNEMALRLGPAKGKDGANTLGPMLVTPDELEPYRSRNAFDLGMTGYVNGELVSEGCWDTIDWGFADMITYTSRGTHLRPGDVIGSGTVPSGCLFEHFALDPDGFRGWLQPGDEVRLVVEQLGELRQRVVPGVKPEPLSSGY